MYKVCKLFVSNVLTSKRYAETNEGRYQKCVPYMAFRSC